MLVAFFSLKLNTYLIINKTSIPFIFANVAWSIVDVKKIMLRRKYLYFFFKGWVNRNLNKNIA